MERPSVVIGLSFGSRPREGPDPVNERLAQLCDQVARAHIIPIVAQWEIGTRTACRCDLIIEREGNAHLDTRRVMEIAKEWCIKNNARDVALVAGSFHAWRVKAVARRLGFRVILVRTHADVWDSESDQWWTHGPLRNLVHESLAIFYYWICGWI